MRLAAIASALAIVLCVAVFGAIFLQKASIPAPASVPATASAPATPTEGRAPGSVLTVADDAADSAAAAPVAVAQATPAAGAHALDYGELVQQSQCLGHRAGGRNRHHWRSRLRLRAFQGPRLLARRRSRAHVR